MIPPPLMPYIHAASVYLLVVSMMFVVGNFLGRAHLRQKSGIQNFIEQFLFIDEGMIRSPQDINVGIIFIPVGI